MTEQPQNEQEAEQSTEISKVYGAKLKAARLSLQLSIDNVAQELNLHKNIILSLEEMDEEKLPTSAFVKGYIRSYAKLVDLDGDELVKDYAKDEVKEEYNFVPSNNNTSETLNKRKSDEPSFKVAVGVFIAIGLLLIILSWQSKNQTVDEQSNVPEQAEKLAEKASTDKAAETVESKINDETKSLNAESEVQETVDPATESSDQAMAEKATPLPVEKEKENTEQSASQPENTQSTGESTAGADNNERKQATEKAAASGKVMTISVSDDAWMEIRNQQGKRLFTNVLAAGKTIRFDSSDLYRLIIGRAGVVKIAFEGQEIDFSAYKRSNGTARFILSSRGLAAYQRSPQATVKTNQPKPDKSEQNNTTATVTNPKTVPPLKTDNTQQAGQQSKTAVTDTTKTEQSKPVPPPSEIVTEDIE